MTLLPAETDATHSAYRDVKFNESGVLVRSGCTRFSGGNEQQLSQLVRQRKALSGARKRNKRQAQAIREWERYLYGATLNAAKMLLRFLT